MKEYKGKITAKLFWMACGFCAGWFVFNLVGKFTHSTLFAGIAAIVVIAFMLYKVFVCDNITIIITDDKQLLIKRFGKIIKSFIINNYYWSEYSKNSNTKDAEDQDIYYVSKENGEENYIDCSNFSGDDYEELLTELGAKGQDVPPVKVETIKK
ncbi:hypothetical protein DBY21_04125 [Candidatus Gastranaerophilales bacterium]|nr:MAG: hypothetical protein DBY21_04125 [Candidatus Gastranaerophilales bacterium]